LLEHIAPGRQVGVAAVTRSLGIGHDHLHAVLEQVGPVLQGLRVALAHDEHGGRSERRAVVRQAGHPVVWHQLAVVGQGVDVGGHVHGDDIGRQAIDHRTRLLARAAEGHLHIDLLVVLGFPVLLEGRVVVLVEVTHHVIGNVQQGRGSLGQVAEGQAGGEQ